MDGPSVPDLARTTFRTSAAFELIVFDRLSAEEQLALNELRRDPTFYGVLRPRVDNGLTIKAVDKDTALLWLTLQQPGPVPAFVWTDDAAAAASGLRQLVLDGVLEISRGDVFVSGAAAGPAFVDGPRSHPRGRLAALSIAALGYAERLELTDQSRLAMRLYHYGRQPRTAAWANRLPNANAVLAFVGAADGTVLQRQLASNWRASDKTINGWLTWSNARSIQTTRASNQPTYKLYVSPAPADLPHAFAHVAQLGAVAPEHFKIGSDVNGVLRPDKLVLYFPTLERLHAAAADLQSRLDGVAPHGVPFSSEISGDGLLSWGMDPPADARVVSWQEQESWRLWIVRRLARAMVAAQAAPDAAMSPAHFAMERLRHEGVDVEQWTPSPGLWRTV